MNLNIVTDPVLYDNILYAPLWLGVEPPRVDIADIVQWAKDIRPAQLEILKTFDREPTIYDQGYELMHAEGFVSMVTHPVKPGEWFEDFDKRFPELAAFFDMYPLKNKRIFAQTYTASESMSEKVHMKFHLDRDATVLGFRFSAYVDEKPRLIFKRIKASHLNFYKARHGRRCTFPLHHGEPHALRINVLPGPHAWCMNTESITHAVDGYPLNSRSIFVIYGELDEERFKSVMDASMHRYYGYFLTSPRFDAQLQETLK